MTAPLSLVHLNLPAHDPPKQAAWYEEKLGLKRVDNQLWSEGTLLVFTEGKPQDNIIVHFGFRVPSVDALKEWVETLRSRGVEVPEITGDEGYAHVYVLDPEGNKFEIFTYTEPE